MDELPDDAIEAGARRLFVHDYAGNGSGWLEEHPGFEDWHRRQAEMVLCAAFPLIAARVRAEAQPGDASATGEAARLRGRLTLPPAKKVEKFVTFHSRVENTTSGGSVSTVHIYMTCCRFMPSN